MRFINILIVYITIGLNIIYAQVPSSSLFLIVDKETDSINISDKTEGKTISWKIDTDEKKNWSISFQHYNSKGRNHGRYRYLLPKEMVQNFIKKGNAITLDQFKEEIYPLDIASLHKMIRLRSYYYEYLDKNEYKTNLRQNIFLIFKSDLDNTYVECFELSVVVSTMVEY